MDEGSQFLFDQAEAILWQRISIIGISLAKKWGKSTVTVNDYKRGVLDVLSWNIIKWCLVIWWSTSVMFTWSISLTLKGCGIFSVVSVRILAVNKMNWNNLEFVSWNALLVLFCDVQKVDWTVTVSVMMMSLFVARVSVSWMQLAWSQLLGA